MAKSVSTAIPYGPSRRPWRETLSAVAVSADGKLLVSAPGTDPLQHSVVPDGVTSHSYQVPSSALTLEEHDRAMEETVQVLNRGCKTMFGFMASQNFQMPSSLQSHLTNVAPNNAGDPFTVGTPFNLQPKWMERNVLDYFASLWNAKWPHDPNNPNSYWGYVLTMGSTEGNMHALWTARNELSRKFIGAVKSINFPPDTNNKVPVVMFSQNSNFSLIKLCDIVQISRFDEVGREEYPNENPLGGEWVQGVPCSGGDAGPGTVDIDALEKLVDFFSGKGHPIVVIFNYGTTLKGACDDIQAAGERLVKVLKKNNMYERTLVDIDNPTTHAVCKGFWFHVDGALSAAYMPFLEMAYKNRLTDVKPASVFDFRLDFISSIVMSGHKYIGTPWPCGVYIVQRPMRLAERKHSYIGTYDTTVSLSRNAHSPILLWSYISTKPYDAQVASIVECLHLVTYALCRFKELQSKIGIDLWIMNTSPSLSIVFRRPNTRIIAKYMLSICSLCIHSEERLLAQVYIMQHITTDIVNALIEDLQASDAFF